MSADVRENKRPAVIDRRYSAIFSHLLSEEWSLHTRCLDEEVFPMKTSLQLPDSSHTPVGSRGAGESQLRQIAGTFNKRFQAPPSITPAAEAKRSRAPRQFSSRVKEALSSAPGA